MGQANGIGSPRLLLQSAQKDFPDGLANSNGIVGKYLMHHVFAFCDSWFDEPVEGFKGSFGAPLYSHEFYHTVVSRGFVNGFGMQVARSFGPAYAAMGTHTGYTAPWGENLPHLFVVDGSTLTTGGAVNPTSTIGALACRSAEYITRNFHDITSQKSTPSNRWAPPL